jgi:hypothetical protein
MQAHTYLLHIRMPDSDVLQVDGADPLTATLHDILAAVTDLWSRKRNDNMVKAARVCL